MRNILVLGASGRIGRVVAQHFMDHGDYVIGQYFKNENCVGNIKIQADLIDIDSVYKIFNQIKCPDVIINCVLDNKFSILEIDKQNNKDYIDQFNSQVIVMVNIYKVFSKCMKNRRSGRIICINSVCVDQYNCGFSTYILGKVGLDAILKSMIVELSQYQITINQIIAGWTITEEERKLGINNSINQTIPMKRRGNDYDIANAALFFASEEANYITGAILPVCGGVYMNKI